MNKPLQALIERTDYLKQQIDQVTAGENLIGSYANMASDTEVGDAVYLDADTETVKKALSGFAPEFAQDGSFRLAASGYVLGIVIEKTSETSGRIWLTGTITDQDLADDALGVSADPGIYRLSMTNNGELTADEQELDILVLQYHGGGVMTMFDKRAAIPNHIHQTYLLEESWLLASDSAFDDMEKPVGAAYGYDIANDANMQRIFATVPGSIRVFGDGELIAETVIVSNLDNIWSLSIDPSVTYTVIEATITMPYTFGEPVLRGARTDTPEEILLSAEQGILTANMQDWQTEADTPDGTAIRSIVGRTYKTVQVVTDVGVLGDLQKSTDSEGKITISLGLGINSFLEPQIVNLNNAIEESDGYYVYYALPSGRDAAMLGRISLPFFQDAVLEAAVVAEVQGLSGGGAIPALNIDYSVKAYPSVAVAMGSSWDGSFTLPTPAIANNEALIVEADPSDRFNVTSRGTVFLKVGYDTPAEDIKITRFGVILYTV
jgi:hypothetical protein